MQDWFFYASKCRVGSSSMLLNRSPTLVFLAISSRSRTPSITVLTGDERVRMAKFMIYFEAYTETGHAGSPFGPISTSFSVLVMRSIRVAESGTLSLLLLSHLLHAYKPSTSVEPAGTPTWRVSSQSFTLWVACRLHSPPNCTVTPSTLFQT
jgi:hypothetical protein